MMRSGWMIDTDYSNKQDWEQMNVQKEMCEQTDTFYGYKEGMRVGSVSAFFKGSGKGILKYGNCNSTGYVTMSLNGLEIDWTTDTNYGDDVGLVSFQYKRDDFLEIKEQNMGIIKLHLFVIFDAGSYINRFYRLYSSIAL